MYLTSLVLSCIRSIISRDTDLEKGCEVKKIALPQFKRHHIMVLQKPATFTYCSYRFIIIIVFLIFCWERR